jgi:archaemetzincin
MKRELTLLKLNPIEKNIIDYLKLELLKLFEGIFEQIHVIENSKNFLDKFYNKNRRQYNASKILDHVKIIEKKENYYRILVITSEDLYTEGLNYVFGVAHKPSFLNSSKSAVAVISLKRLKEEFYSLPKNSDLFRLRIIKEAIHELGHTLGLDHCKNKCVMQFSNWIGDTDEKPARFCSNCLQILKKFSRLN